jgi:hypothetical protein
MSEKRPQQYFKHFADKIFLQIVATVHFETIADRQNLASFQKVKEDNRPITVICSTGSAFSKAVGQTIAFMRRPDCQNGLTLHIPRPKTWGGYLILQKGSCRIS